MVSERMDWAGVLGGVLACERDGRERKVEKRRSILILVLFVEGEGDSVLAAWGLQSFCCCPAVPGGAVS
jgi:hypothetical protein